MDDGVVRWVCVTVTRKMKDQCLIDLAAGALERALHQCGISNSQRAAIIAQFEFELEYALFGEVEAVEVHIKELEGVGHDRD